MKHILRKTLRSLSRAETHEGADPSRRHFLRRAASTPLALAAGSASLHLLHSGEAQAQPPMSPYGVDERDRRWTRLRDFMSQNDLECMILPKARGAGEAFFQFAEYYSNGFFMNPGAVIFPLKGEPAVIGSMPLPNAWITKRGTKWTDDGDQPPISDQIVDFVKDMGYENGRIGVVGTRANIDGLNEFNNEGFIPYATWARVLKGLPKADFQDVTGPLATLMMVKSEAEIENTIRASLLGERLHEMMLDITKVGMDTMDLHLAVADFMIRNKARTDVEAIMLPPGKLPDGFVINSEYGIIHQGGYAQVTLCIACGKIDKEIEKMAAVAHDVMDYGKENLLPGKRFGDVIEPMEKIIADSGYWHFVPVIHGLPMHAIGPVCEGPAPQGPCSKTRAADMIVESGMSFTFEPTAQAGPMGPFQKSVKVGGMAVTTADGLNMINTLGLRMQRVS